MTAGRIVRVTLFAAVALAALLVLLLGASALLLQTEAGRAHLARLVERLASTSDGGQLRIGRIAPGLPLRLMVDEIILADADGPWLSARDLRFSWRPWALLSGELHVQELSARAINVTRAPAPSPAEPQPERSEPLQIPQLPLAVRIDRIGIAELRLDQPVLGTPAAFTIDGSLAAVHDGMIRSALRIDRHEGEGQVRLSADYDQSSRELSVDGVIREPADGLLLTLAGASSPPPLSVTLKGQGPIADWQGTLDGDAPGWGNLRADLGLQAAEQSRVTARGTLQITTDPLPALRPALAEGVAFDLAILLPDAETVAIERLALHGSGLSLSGSGRLEDGGSAAQAEATLLLRPEALAADLLAPAQFASADVALSLSGPVAAPDIAASAEVLGPRAQGMRAGRLVLRAEAGPADAAAADAKLAISAHGHLDELVLDDPVAGAALGGRPTLALDAVLANDTRMLTVRTLSIAGAQLRLDAQGDVPLAEGEIAASADLVLADLAPLARAAGAPDAATGRVAAGVTLRGTLQPLAVEGDAQLGVRSLATGSAAADALAGSTPRIDARFRFADDSGLSIPRIALAGAAISGEGDAQLAAGFETLRARLRLDVPSLAPLAGPLATELRGVLGIDLTAQGATADPDVAVAVRLRDAQAAGVEIREARADLSATSVGSRPSGRLIASAATSRGPLSASTDFRMLSDDVLRVSALSAAAAGLRLTGAVDVATGSGLADGRLLLVTEPASPGMAADAPVVTGPLRLDLTLSAARTAAAGFAANSAQAVDGTLSGGPLVIRGDAAEPLRIGSVGGELAVRDALASPGIRATLRAGEISAGAVDVQRMQATVDGTSRQARFSLDAMLAGEAKDRIEAAGVVTSADEVVTVVVERLDGQVGGERLALQRPARVVSAPGSLQVAGLDLHVGEGRLTADGVLRQGETTVRLRATALPADLAHAYASAAPTKGAVDLELDLRTAGVWTNGDLAVRLRDLRWDAEAHGGSAAAANLAAAEMDGTVQVRLSDRLARLTITLDGPGEASVRGSGALPVRLRAGSTTPDLDRNALVEGQLRLLADVEKLSRLLALDDQRMEGTLQGDITLGGSLADPRLGGNLTLSDGLYENFVVGTLLRDLAVRIDAVDARTLTVQGSGSDGNSGRIAIDGRGRLDAAGMLQADATLKAEAATLVRRDDATATTGADLAFSLAGTDARLSGRIETTTIEISLLERLPPSVAILPVREIGRQEADDERPQAAAQPLNVALDLSIAMPRRVFVRGRGLESEWSGALTVTGTAAAPRILGSVNLVRGNFAFAGKRFDLQRGDVAFTGSDPIDPLITAVAEYRAANLTAQIRITGFASDPKLEITSQPPLPQSEVLAQVLFGKSTSDLGPVEAVQLAAALDTLARGDSMSDDVFSFARTMLGLDTLTVKPNSSGDGGNSLAVGRYVGDRVYIGAEQGIEGGGQAGTVEVEVAPGVSITSEIGQSATTGTQGALGLKFRWDY